MPPRYSKDMRRIALALIVMAFLASAANVKLYLKDGSYHLVREYQVQPDRVRFYSLERSDWEEMPLDLVDLEKTRTEEREHKAQIEKDAKAVSEEERVEREMQQEVQRIPEKPGVYWLEGKETKLIKAAESTMHTSKGRSVLKVLAPMPIVPGKATLELQGAHSSNVFSNPDQEFFIQLSDPERFGIAKLKPQKDVRIVENVTIMPVTNETVEEPEMVEIFQKQLTSGGLYKIWPKQSLPPGEYAVVEFTEGKVNIQVWDFAMKAQR
jgi:hypothetical protein